MRFVFGGCKCVFQAFCECGFGGGFTSSCLVLLLVSVVTGFGEDAFVCRVCVRVCVCS